MKTTLVLLTLAALLSLVSVAYAQSGGGYDLSWSTVDGGGHSWSTGGNYSLGGTIGQYDADGKHTGGNYALQGGFWHPVCRPMTVDVIISCDGSRVQLDWISNPANSAYTIHRATSPYQPPVSSNPLNTVLAPPWNDAINTCGNPANNNYYVVRSTCLGAHTDNDERAEFDFSLTPGD
jgi:hypothetical protein